MPHRAHIPFTTPSSIVMLFTGQVSSQTPQALHFALSTTYPPYLLREMARLGHASAQAPQVMQLNALPSTMRIAPVGHSLMHSPLPLHFLVVKNMSFTFQLIFSYLVNG